MLGADAPPDSQIAASISSAAHASATASLIDSARPAKSLYLGATAVSEDLGLFDATRNRPNRCCLVRVKRLPKGRLWRYASGKVHVNSNSRKQSARIVHRCVEQAGLDTHAYGTHTMRRTKVSLIYRRTKNLRAVQILLGHTRIESTVR